MNDFYLISFLSLPQPPFDPNLVPIVLEYQDSGGSRELGALAEECCGTLFSQMKCRAWVPGPPWKARTNRLQEPLLVFWWAV